MKIQQLAISYNPKFNSVSATDMKKTFIPILRVNPPPLPVVPAIFCWIEGATNVQMALKHSNNIRKFFRRKTRVYSGSILSVFLSVHRTLHGYRVRVSE